MAQGLGDIRTHCLVTSLWIARGHHNRPSSLMELTRQRCGPSTHVWVYGSAAAHSIPPSLVLCSASVFHASHRGLGRVFPGPVRTLWLWQTSPGTYDKKVHSVTPRASLAVCRIKAHRSSADSSTAGQPSGLPCFLPRAVKGSTWLALAALLLSFSPSPKAQG